MNPQHQSVSIILYPWYNFKDTCWEKCKGTHYYPTQERTFLTCSKSIYHDCHECRIAQSVYCPCHGLDDQGIRANTFLSQSIQTGPEPTQLPIEQVQGALYLGVKELGHEANHSPLTSAEVQNVWSYTSTSTHFFMAWCLIRQRDYFYHHIHLPSSCIFWHIRIQ
jgi:hypothetical protein